MKALEVLGRTWHVEDLQCLADLARMRPETRELGETLQGLLQAVNRPAPAMLQTRLEGAQRAASEARAQRAMARSQLRAIRHRLEKLVTSEPGARDHLTKELDEVISALA